MPKSPVVSMVMPVYNEERYVARAIESVLGQTFGDFEFLIVDDGSLDSTGAIVAGYALKDDRIEVLHQIHGGVASALNLGCSAARGRYIARMDADDISLPTRLEKQVGFFEENPDIGILGTNIREFGQRGPLGSVWRRPTTPAVIGWFLMFGNPLAHPSVMMRRDVFERFGPYRACAGEDYDFWVRASDTTKIANVPSTLIEYCIRDDQVSRLIPARATDLRLQRELVSRLIRRDVGPEAFESTGLNGNGAVTTSSGEFEAALAILLEVHGAYTSGREIGRDDRAEIALDVLARLRRLSATAGGIGAKHRLSVKLRMLQFLPKTFSARQLRKAASWALGA